MNLFGKNYLSVRNENVLPLISYGVKRAKYQHWSFKDVITSNIVSLNKLSGKSVEIEIRKEDYYRALHCDIELFMNKSAVQYADFLKSKSNSPCWSFVTFYYLTFFAVTCFFRFLNRGFIFLSREQKDRLEQFSLAVYSSPITLDSGNYYFKLKEVNAVGNIILTLSFKGESVHKLNWIQLEATFREFIPNCDHNERTMFNCFLSHFSAFRNDFPSSLRNALNYNGESTILDLENSIPYIEMKNLDSDFLKTLFSIGMQDLRINHTSSLAHLTSYLIEFNNELYNEYMVRSGFGKDFARERNQYLEAAKR
ncbi:hypothetical protein DYBT9623_01744 [Dyadobacter sp. CECT 9623]|uniref:Uncharacterized protein n=1 Tax=Dyadobacter linearis TaxID=2823330 RepID=A0ABN7R4F2_9BACT|nr:hypothetical protein [Dyadobacter sp. CECT 9623]CAG5069010.1 hypothetical protein DYBT9623_01744 [Dyadobacter sp. CECT 9623]